MAVCAACGAENRAGARFCDNCGAQLVAPAAPREQRKVVTVVFCDVTGSTALGERLDPESLRRVLGRYFEEATRVIDRHGGTVEKFIGDAVMAVFGVPVLHEDDALRAVRAAAEVREALVRLNAELERDYGTALAVRIGVNTGEVVTGTAERLATGDAVTVAARLEQAAQPGEILLGRETLALVRDAAVVEEVEPLQLKGKSGPVPAFRLLEARAEVPDRRPGSPMVGRETELHRLQDAYEQAVRDRSCQLFTVLGMAGVGKSRLAAEFLQGPPARVLRGRCLPYGEGITYWPVVEVVKQLLGQEAEPRAAELLGGEVTATAALAGLLGDSGVAISSEEIAWAVRKLLEGAAQERPLVIVFDDIHWGEPAFLDLVEHVTDLAREAPILVLCLARPELFERRPGWGGGKLNATTVLLEPLDTGETDELIELLVGRAPLDEALRLRVRDAAGGNPLFVEEMLAMLRDSGGREVAVPPTIQALLAARLDQLDSVERDVLERGAVEGEVFHRGAVEALGPEAEQVGTQLVALVRKDLLRPAKAQLAGEEAFRFRHLLIRDAAYDGLPKARRARLHERFARWLDHRAGTLVERDELVGYHLEQAYGYRIELGPADEATRELAAEAGAHLDTAGRRALNRGDYGAAVSLLERAGRLLPTGQLDLPLELSLANALVICGRPADAVARAGKAAVRAAAAGDRVGELRAQVEQLRFLSENEGHRVQELQALIEEARPVFEQAGDDGALGSLWRAVAQIEHFGCRHGASAEAMFQAIEHARRAGDRDLERRYRRVARVPVVLGPMPVELALRWLDEAQTRSPVYEPSFDVARAELLALLGRFDEARQLWAQGVASLADRGITHLAAALTAEVGSRIELLAGDAAAAERAGRSGCEQLERLGDRGALSTTACLLAQALYELGRHEEAEQWAARGTELAAGEDDIVTEMLARQVRAKLLVRRGDHEAAKALVSEAVALAETMQAPVSQGDAVLDHAEVLMIAGESERAAELVERAVAFYEQKGAVACVARAHALLEQAPRVSHRP